MTNNCIVRLILKSIRIFKQCSIFNFVIMYFLFLSRGNRAFKIDKFIISICYNVLIKKENRG